MLLSASVRRSRSRVKPELRRCSRLRLRPEHDVVAIAGLRHNLRLWKLITDHCQAPCCTARFGEVIIYNNEFSFQLGLCLGFGTPCLVLNYASMVRTLYSYIARGAGGCRSRQPQIPGAGGIHSSACGGNLFVSVSRQPVVQQDHGHRARGDGQDRAGVFFAGAASAGSLGGAAGAGR